MVEGGGLENRCAERYRGFESYSLRHYKNKALQDLSGTCGPFFVSILSFDLGSM